MAGLFTAILNSNIPLLWASVFLLLIPFFWSFSKFKHRRYQNNILFLAFFFCAIITIQILGFASTIVALPLYALLGAYLFVALYTPRNLLFPESSPLFLLKTLVREGNFHAVEKRFLRKPLYIQSTLAKMIWNSLWAGKFLKQERPREAYEKYSKLLNLPLFEDEEVEIRLKQVLSLFLLGDTNNAKRIFGQIKTKAEEHRSYEVLWQQSLFDERCGEFEKAHQNLLSAMGEKNESLQSIELARIYNNLGRMEKMLGNVTNVVHYYRKAADLASRHHDKNLIHIAYPNIIDTYLLINDNDNAGSSFSKYSELIDKENIDDLLKFNNYRLEYARQKKNKVYFLETVVRGRIEILPRLTEQEQNIYAVKELRIRFNGQCGWDEQLFWLSYHLPEYLKLEFPSRYYMVKEIFLVLRDLAQMNALGPFASLFLQLLQFMVQSKQDIDQYLISLPDYCVNERCFWEKEKAFLRKVQRTNDSQEPLREFCEGLLEHLRNIKAIQLRHGNPLAAIDADLNIADECMGLAQTIQEETIRTYLLLSLREHLSKACKDLEKFRGHPASKEYALRIARYALFVDNKEVARKYFEYFIQSRIDILHYANWLQLYYQDLTKVFGVEKG